MTSALCWCYVCFLTNKVLHKKVTHFLFWLPVGEYYKVHERPLWASAGRCSAVGERWIVGMLASLCADSEVSCCWKVWVQLTIALCLLEVVKKKKGTRFTRAVLSALFSIRWRRLVQGPPNFLSILEENWQPSQWVWASTPCRLCHGENSTWVEPNWKPPAELRLCCQDSPWWV